MYGIIRKTGVGFDVIYDGIGSLMTARKMAIKDFFMNGKETSVVNSSLLADHGGVDFSDKWFMIGKRATYV